MKVAGEYQDGILRVVSEDGRFEIIVNRSLVIAKVDERGYLKPVTPYESVTMVVIPKQEKVQS